MSRITALFVGVAALTVISTVAEAEDGCGRGWYHNGRRSLKHGSTARRTSRFRMGCVSHTQGVRPPELNRGAERSRVCFCLARVLIGPTRAPHRRIHQRTDHR
jgi:hypothetical protein